MVKVRWNVLDVVPLINEPPSCLFFSGLEQPKTVTRHGMTDRRQTHVSLLLCQLHLMLLREYVRGDPLTLALSSHDCKDDDQSGRF